MIDFAVIADWFKTWPRLVFMVFTHRFVRLAPGVYVQIPRSMTDREVADTLRAALNKHQQHRKGK